jgi:hypothetical protein
MDGHPRHRARVLQPSGQCQPRLQVGVRPLEIALLQQHDAKRLAAAISSPGSPERVATSSSCSPYGAVVSRRSSAHPR